MHDQESGWTEPDITINGQVLSVAQAMTLRVAVSSMRLSLSAPSMRNGIGEPLANGYDLHLQAIEQLMLSAQRSTSLGRASAKASGRRLLAELGTLRTTHQPCSYPSQRSRCSICSRIAELQSWVDAARAKLHDSWEDDLAVAVSGYEPKETEHGHGC